MHNNQKGDSMKKIAVFSFVMFIFIVALVPLTSADGILKVNISKYEPLPAEPGDFVTIYIEVENVGSNDARNVMLEILPEFPFNIDEASRTKNLGIIGAKKQYVAEFEVRVDEDAVAGTNKLKVRYSTNPPITPWVQNDLDIRIESVGRDLQIISAHTEPEELVPGETGKLRIRVKNEASTAMRDIKFNLNLADTTTTTYPFVPIGTTTQQRIAKLNPGQSSEFVYDIKPYPDAASKLYKVPVTVTYADYQNNNFTKTDLVGVVVNSEPEILTTIDDYQKDGSLILKVTNRGLTDVKFLTVTLLPSDDYTLVSQSSTYYIGELESDDFDTTDFTIRCSKENITLPVQITYRDANNNPYDETVQLNLHQATSCNGNGGGMSATTWIISIIILGIIGWIVYRKRKKRKK